MSCLLSLFVALWDIFLARADNVIGYHRPLFHIFFFDTQTGHTWWVQFREVEGQKR